MTDVGAAPVAARREVQARLHRRADEALRGAGGLVLITGEAGIGKTTLLAGLAAHVRGRAQVCWGRGFPDAPGYWPWREALRGFDAAALLAADVLADGADTFRLWEDVTAAVLDAGEPVVLLLDDLQWADAASLRLLGFLSRRLAAGPVLVAAASRAPEPVADAATVPLAGLSPPEVGELVADVLGTQAPPEAVAHVVRQTGGNPFFVRQLALLWPDVETMPPGISAVLSRRLDGLSAPAVELLAAASVFPGPIPAGVPEQMAGLDEVLRARILVGTGPYAFCHDLFRSYCFALLDAGTRKAWHDAAADVCSSPAEIAYHLVRGNRPTAAMPFLARAAEQATRRMAYDEAVEHRRTVLSLGPPRADAVLALADALRRAGELVEAGEAFARAAVLAEDAEQYVRAVLGLHGLHAQTVRQSPTELIEMLRGALGRLGATPGPSRALAAAALARVLAWSGTGIDEARGLAAEAVILARAHRRPCGPGRVPGRLA